MLILVLLYLVDIYESMVCLRFEAKVCGFLRTFFIVVVFQLETRDGQEVSSAIIFYMFISFRSHNLFLVHA